MPEPSILVVLPVFNEKAIAPAVAAEMRSFAASHPTYRLRIVDDGSSDGTPDVFCRELKGISNVQVTALPRNGGKGNAVKAGFQDATEDLLLFVDGDLAYPLAHLERLVEALATSDLAIGSRELVDQHPKGLHNRRRLLGWGFNRLVCGLLHFDYPDTQAGFKGFRREAAAELMRRQRVGGFAFDAELLFLAGKLGYSVAQVPAEVSRQHNYKLSKVKLLKDSWDCLRDVLEVVRADRQGLYD